MAGAEGVPLAGARVEIVELRRAGTSSVDGEIQFHDLPAGSYTLRVSAGSPARSAERRVQVSEAEPLQVAVALESVQGQPVITVMGHREAARTAEREAPNIISVITADEIRSLPEVSAAEAVRRVPGISAENDTGEARFINIRGLNSDLNGTTFAGVRMLPTNPASPLGGGRAVAFDVIPAGLIGSITVTKTNTPDQDAEALGGTIELTPRRLGADEPGFVNARIGSGYEPLRQTGIIDLQLSGGTRFGSDNAFSAVGTIAVYEDHRGIDDLEEGYADNQANGVPDKAFANLQQRYYKLRRTRLGFGGELAYQPSEAHRWYLDAYQTGYTEFQNKNYLVIDLNQAATFLPGSNTTLTDSVADYVKHATDHQETLRARLLSLGGRDLLGTGTLDYRASYAEGRYIVTKDFSWDFQAAGGATINYDNITHPNWPSYVITGGPDRLDPASYTLGNVANGSEHDRDREYSGALNWASPLHLGGDSDELKLGASARLRDKILQPHQISFIGSSIPPVSLAQFVKPNTISYYDNHYQIGNEFDLPALETYYAAGNGLVEDVATDALTDASTYQHDREDVYALYAQYRWTRGNLQLLGGLRAEHTRATYQANAINADDPANPIITLNTQSNSYSNAFPTLQARYEISPRFLFRASVSSAIARPGFNQITAAISLSPSSGTITQGNPALRPTTGYNLDLGLDKYFEGGGVLSIGVFDKELRNYIIQQDQHLNDASQLPPNPIYQGFTGPVVITTFANIREARVTGLEFAWEQQFKELPGLWSGLGAGANWTWVRSRGDLRPGMVTDLPGTSRNTANAEIFYEYDGLSVKLAGYYTSRTLFTPTPGDPTGYTDSYQSERFILDFGSNYAFNKTTGLYFNVKNLTNNPMRYTEGPENRPIQREFYGVTLQAGVVLSF
ncbi:MAG: TonB-dependent receptor [Gammaproteobacteria bacterium]|nr:TonB-dependent receptor [Gammaproteobacteria bacterium]